MAVSELPGNPNAVWTVKKRADGNFKNNFLKKILILYAKTILSLRGLKMKNSTWNVICTIGQTLRIFPKIHFFHVLVLLIYLCNYLCNMYFLFVFDLFFMKKGWHVDFDQHQSLLAFQILDEIDPPYVMKKNPWNRRELSFNFLKSY